LDSRGPTYKERGGKGKGGMGKGREVRKGGRKGRGKGEEEELKVGLLMPLS